MTSATGHSEEANTSRRRLSILELLDKSASAYPELSHLSDAQRLRWANEESVARRKANTVRYILASGLAIFFLAILPVALQEGYRCASLIAPTVIHLLDQGSFLKEHSAIRFSLLGTVFAIFTYTIILPGTGTKGIFPRRAVSRYAADDLTDINRLGIPFIMYTAFLLYLVIGIALLEGHSFDKPHASLWSSATMAWLTVPMILVPMIIAALPFVLIAGIIASRYGIERYSTSIAILRLLLLNLVELIEVPNTRELAWSKRLSVMRRIEQAADSLPMLFGRVRPFDPVENWARSQLAAASAELRSLASWIAIPKPDTVQIIKARLVLYVNAIADGDLDSLPRAETSGSLALLHLPVRKRTIGRLLLLLFLLIYVVSPPIAWAFFADSWHWATSEIGRPALLIAYIAWLVAGLFSFVEHMAPEARSVFFDVIRLVARRE
jgi:hypothetical protein